METIITVNNLTKEYKLGKISTLTFFQDLFSKFFRNIKKRPVFKALDNVSFSIQKGQKVGIIGTNGAGKSTLLKILSRITCPTSGEAELNGRVSSMLEVGTGFHSELTGRENIYLNGAILGMSKKEIDSKVDEIIKFSECEQFIDTPVKRYSSGMYVKLAFSVAAHLDSEILIMDEVLAVGDIAFQTKCINKMELLSTTQNKTILYVSHNMNTIRKLCNRCIVLNKGKVIYDGEVEKAIQCYSDASSSKNLENTFNNYIRNDNLTNYKVLIQKAGFLNLNENIIRMGTKLKLFIEILSKQLVTDIFIKCIVQKQDKTPVGISMSQSVCDCKENSNKRIEFELDTSFLAPAKYTITLILFYPDGFGNQEKFDMVEDALSFEVRSTEGQLYNWEWKNNWGSVLIPEIKICSIESIADEK